MKFINVLKSICKWIHFQTENQHSYIKWPSPVGFLWILLPTQHLTWGFSTLNEKDCKISFVWLNFYIPKNIWVFYFTFSIPIKLRWTFIFECRGIIYTTILASRENLWNHFCNFMPFQNYNICKYRRKKKCSVLPCFHALAEKFAMYLPYKMPLKNYCFKYAFNLWTCPLETLTAKYFKK